MMNLTDCRDDDTGLRFYGIYRGLCTNNVDPEGLGRIKAIIPTVYGSSTTESDWAWAGAGLDPPAPGTGVWIMFEAGDPDSPVWVGLWPVVGGGPINVAGGDLTGTYPNPIVDGLQGRAISPRAPTTGQVMEWSGTAWTPTILGTGGPPNGPATGDLNGTYPSPTVDGLQGRAVSSAVPTTNQLLEWNGTAWTPSTWPNLPAPVTTGGTVGFTDSTGEVWVAAPSVSSGVWKRARDVLRCRMRRAAALGAASAATTIPFDTVDYDPYQMCFTGASANVTVPFAGVYFVSAVTATGGGMTDTAQYGLFFSQTSPAESHYGTIFPVGGTVAAAFIFSKPCYVNAPGAAFTVQYLSPGASMQTGLSTHIQVVYMGSG